MVCRNKYNFYRCEYEEIDAIVGHAIWGKVLRGRPHPCCASECLGCWDSDGFASIVNVSNAAFFNLFSIVLKVIFNVLWLVFISQRTKVTFAGFLARLQSLPAAAWG